MEYKSKTNVDHRPEDFDCIDSDSTAITPVNTSSKLLDFISTLTTELPVSKEDISDTCSEAAGKEKFEQNMKMSAEKDSSTSDNSCDDLSSSNEEV